MVENTLQNIVEFKKVSKKYGSCQALEDVTLNIEKGKIYGLIGKNGAGKTTLMRLIAGLSFPTSGTVELYGEVDNSKEVKRRIGSLIEYPTLNDSMTAKENLKLFRILYGIKDAMIEDALLELVELKEAGRKKVKNYSLGMRQRLGIAVAMLGNPEFIILDEPVNGLDPIGVIAIRKLIQKMNKEMGMTVLISSHNLPELYQTATDYVIIDKGMIKKQITFEELEEQGNEDLEEYFISVIGGKENE